MSFNLAQPVLITNASSNVDFNYGPFNSVAAANAAVIGDLREKGRTVGILVGGSVVEYWWESGITDSDLVVKGGATAWGTITGTLSDQTDLQTALNDKQAALVSGTNIKTINGNSILGSGDLVVTTAAAGTDGQVQYNNGGAFGGASSLVYDDTNNRVGVGTSSPAKKLEVEDSNQCVALFTSTTTGAGITFSDSTTSDNEQVGVGAFGNLLCLRGGGNAGGTMQLSGTQIDCRLNVLKNFIASIQQVSTNLTIDSSNEQTYCGQVIQATGALTITFDSTLANGFNVSIIQMDSNQTTIATTGATNVRNRQGHTKTAGQYATITLLKNSTNLFLGGDTA